MSTEVLSADETRAALSMPDAIAAVRTSFVALGAGEFELPQRTVLGEGSALSMAVHHRPTRSTVVKSISADFSRTPAIVGAVVWVSTDSTDVLVADAATVTTIRTGAVVGVATDLLARPEAHRLVVVGAGGQAADQLRAVCAVRPIDTVTLVARRTAAAVALRDDLGDEIADLDVRVTTDLQAALHDADVRLLRHARDRAAVPGREPAERRARQRHRFLPPLDARAPRRPPGHRHRRGGPARGRTGRGR